MSVRSRQPLRNDSGSFQPGARPVTLDFNLYVPHEMHGALVQVEAGGDVGHELVDRPIEVTVMSVASGR